MYEIHFTDGCGIKGLKQMCDVRMSIIAQNQQGRKVEKVLLKHKKTVVDLTDLSLEGLPL